MLAACSAASAGKPAGPAFSSPSAAAPVLSQGRTVHLGGGPQASALDPATATLYEVSENGNAPGTVAVINAATCNALHAAGCPSKPVITHVGAGADAIAVDQATGTVYVGNNSTLSVINGALCNARNTSGCKTSWPTVRVGPVVAGIAVDKTTDMIYVATWGNGNTTTLAVVNGATCNGRDSSGCDQVPAHISVRRSPNGVVFDPANNTVYAVTVSPTLTQALWVINAATCTPATMDRCRAQAVPVTLGKGSANFDVGLAIDQASRTLYVANLADETVSLVGTARCDATDASGCGRRPRLAQAADGPNGIAVDAATHTVYVINEADAQVRVFDTQTCNAMADHCGSRTLFTGGTPQWITLDEVTDTVYVANGDDADMSIFNGAICDAAEAQGCSP